MRIISGIYKIVNTKNGKSYIGSSKNIIRRWGVHKSALKNNRHHCIHLQRSWNKHGESVFRFEIIKEMDHPSEEQLLTEELKTINECLPEYNVGAVGGWDNLTNNPNRDDIIRRIVAAIKERVSKMSVEERKLRWSRPGAKNPNWRGGSSIHYCIDCGKEIVCYAERCLVCSKQGELNSFYGKHHTSDTIEKLRQANLGKTLTEETKEKCRKASIDFYNSEEGRRYVKEHSRKMSGENHPLYGIGHTEESCKKMSKTRIENIANMSIEERYKWNKMRKVRMVRIHNSFYFSLPEAIKHYYKSSESLRFRCDSKNEKWKDYEFIDISSYTDNEDRLMIQRLKDTHNSQIIHD